MKKLLLCIACAALFGACAEDNQSAAPADESVCSDMVPAEHEHPNMVPAVHEHSDGEPLGALVNT